MFEAARQGNVRALRAALAAEPQLIFAVDVERQQTALHVASAAGQAAAAEVLLAGGASPAAVDCSGCTALHHAARAGSEEVVSLLIRAGADVEAESSNIRKRPLHEAALQGSAGERHSFEPRCAQE